MDYRALLKKYIAHVGQVEGTYFIEGALYDNNHYAIDHVADFTDEEVSALIALVGEIQSVPKRGKG